MSGDELVLFEERSTWLPQMDASGHVPRSFTLGDPRVTTLIDARGQLTNEQVKERLIEEIGLMQTCGVQYWRMEARSFSR